MSNIFGMGQAANLLAAGGFWDVVVNALSGVLIWVGDLLVSLIFVVFKFVLNIVDLLQILVERLVGIDFWGQPGASIETFQDSDIIFKFLMSDAVQSAFRTMVVVSIVLLIVFTIIAIIKSEYDVAATGDTKKHSSKMPIFQTAMKSLLTVVLIPILLIMGILASNALLTSLVNALNVNNDLTLGSQVFSVSAYSANRYRVYAATGQRYAAVTEVNYIYEDAADASLNGTFSINPFLTSIMPTSYTAENPFEGFLFKGSDGKEYLFLITSKDADLSNYPAREGLSSWEYKVKVYQKYLADKNLADASSFVDIPSGLGNLNTLKSDHRYIKAAYNTWTYNNRFAESESFEIATDMSNKSAFLAVNGTEAQVTYPQNSE
ncbi:MAG: hypothetical protein IJW24_03155, partial [Clostridia bacterium]|nr:hypothetical protein [Clostridia bacterium]